MKEMKLKMKRKSLKVKWKCVAQNIVYEYLMDITTETKLL